MKQDEKSIKGVWKFKSGVEYEAGDFVVSGENIYLVKKDVPASSTLAPESDTVGEYYKLYPGEMITSKEEYDSIISNLETSTDKYVSSKALNEILKGTYFGLDSDGIIDDTIEVLPSGSIKSIFGLDIDSNSGSDVIDELLVADGFNNGMVKVSKDLESIKNYVKSPINDVEPEDSENKRWIKWDPTKCCKCWECVKCCSYIKKYIDGDESGITIDPGDQTKDYEERSNGDEVTWRTWENAVKICPKKGALEYIDNSNGEVDNVYNDWVTRSGGIDQPKYDIIAYGATPPPVYTYSEWITSMRYTSDTDETAITDYYYVGLPLDNGNFLTAMDYFGNLSRTEEVEQGLCSALKTFIITKLHVHDENNDLLDTFIVGPERLSINAYENDYWAETYRESDLKEYNYPRGDYIYASYPNENYHYLTYSFVRIDMNDPRARENGGTKYSMGNTLKGIAQFIVGIYNTGKNYTSQYTFTYNGITVPNIYLAMFQNWHGALDKFESLYFYNNPDSVTGKECSITLKTNTKLTEERTRTIEENHGGDGNPGNAIKFIKLLKNIENTFGKDGENKISQSGITSSWDSPEDRSTEEDWIEDDYVNGYQHYVLPTNSSAQDLANNLTSWNSNYSAFMDLETRPIGKMWDISNQLVYRQYIIDCGNYNIEWDDDLLGLEKIDKIYLLDRLSLNRLCIKIPEDFIKYFFKSTYTEAQLVQVRQMISDCYDQIGKSSSADSFFIDEEYFSGGLHTAAYFVRSLFEEIGIHSEYMFDVYPYAYSHTAPEEGSDIENYFKNNLYYNSDNTHLVFRYANYLSTNSIALYDDSSIFADDPIAVWRMFNGVWADWYVDQCEDSGLDGSSIIKAANNIIPSGLFELDKKYDAWFLKDIESDKICPLPSLLRRVCYNDWVKVVSNLAKNNIRAVYDGNIKLAPTEIVPRPRTNWHSTNWTVEKVGDSTYYLYYDLVFGQLDSTIEYDQNYFNTHYFEDKNDSYAILKQYSYKDAGNNIQRVQELIDPSYGHVYIRSTNHRAWTSLAPGSNDAMIDLLRKMDRVNNYLANNSLGRTEIVYVPFPQNNSWEGSAGVYQRGSRNICVKFKYFDKVYVSREVTLGNNNPVLATTIAHPEFEPELYIKSSSSSKFEFCDVNGNALSETILRQIEVLEVTEK